MTSVKSLENIIHLLKNGRVVVMPTDTIYGIVGSALVPETVERIYKLRKRLTDKPFIILVASIEDLIKFGIELTKQQEEFLNQNWPNPLSVVLPVENEKWKYLHRGKNSLAFRMPKEEDLLKLLKQTGPLVAPSANIEGEKVSETIDQAKKYFGDKVALYVNDGKMGPTPSTLIKLNGDGSWQTLRKGSYKLPSQL